MPMVLIKSANVAVRFLLELCLLAALGYWGFQTERGLIVKIVLGLGLPLLVAILWGIFLAPASSMRLHGPVSLVLEWALFGIGAAALYATGYPRLAWALLLIYAINKVLMYVWEQ
jgi:hypothetical protein